MTEVVGIECKPSDLESVVKSAEDRGLICQEKPVNATLDPATNTIMFFGKIERDKIAELKALPGVIKVVMIPSRTRFN